MIQKIILAMFVFAVVCAIPNQASAQWSGKGSRIAGSRAWGNQYAQFEANSHPWHGDYYYLPTGQPTALIVPPTATMQTNYSWGVSQNTMTPIYSQFRALPPTGAGGGLFRATPTWPSHTNQFGVYPVRGPW